MMKSSRLKSQLGLGAIGYVLVVSLIGALGVTLSLGLDTLRTRRAAQQLRLMTDLICDRVAQNPIFQGRAGTNFASLVNGYAAGNFPRGAKLTGAYLSIPVAADASSEAHGSMSLSGCGAGIECMFSSALTNLFGPLPVSFVQTENDPEVGQRVICELKAEVAGIFTGFLQPAGRLGVQQLRARSVWRRRVRSPLIPQINNSGSLTSFYPEKVTLFVAPQFETNKWDIDANARVADPRFTTEIVASDMQARAGCMSGCDYPLSMRVGRTESNGAYLRALYSQSGAVLDSQPSAMVLPNASSPNVHAALLHALANPAVLVRNKLVSTVIELLARTSLRNETSLFVVPSIIAQPTPAACPLLPLPVVSAEVNSLIDDSGQFNIPWSEVCDPNADPSTGFIARDISAMHFIAAAQMRMAYKLYHVQESGGANDGNPVNDGNRVQSGISRPIITGLSNDLGGNLLNFDPPYLQSRANSISQSSLTNRWDRTSSEPLLSAAEVIETMSAVQRCPMINPGDIECASDAYALKPALGTLKQVLRSPDEPAGISADGTSSSHVVLIVHDVPPTADSADRAALIQALQGPTGIGRGSTIVYIPVRLDGSSDGRDLWNTLIDAVNAGQVSDDQKARLVVLSPLNKTKEEEAGSLPSRFCLPNSGGNGNECDADETADKAFQAYWYYLLTANGPGSANTSDSIESIAQNIVLNYVTRVELAL